MSGGHPEISEHRLFYFERQKVVVEDLGASGYILDIGGGGEGVIGQLEGLNVIAIDPNKRELEEAASGPLKIIMDVRDLQFLDASFSTVTSFFTLMYIKEPDHEQVFREVFRVLESGGRFLIWDFTVPQCLDEKKDIAVFPLLVKLPDKEIETGYGTPWPENDHDLAYYVNLAKIAGFDVVEQKEHDLVLFLELRKP